MLQVEFIARGKCHGFVLWIDWVMDTEESIVSSTGPGMSLSQSRRKLLDMSDFAWSAKYLRPVFFSQNITLPLYP